VSTRCEIYFYDVTMTSFINIRYGNGDNLCTI